MFGEHDHHRLDAREMLGVASGGNAVPSRHARLACAHRNWRRNGAGRARRPGCARRHSWPASGTANRSSSANIAGRAAQRHGHVVGQRRDEARGYPAHSPGTAARPAPPRGRSQVRRPSASSTGSSESSTSRRARLRQPPAPRLADRARGGHRSARSSVPPVKPGRFTWRCRRRSPWTLRASAACRRTG